MLQAFVDVISIHSVNIAIIAVLSVFIGLTLSNASERKKNSIEHEMRALYGDIMREDNGDY